MIQNLVVFSFAKVDLEIEYFHKLYSNRKKHTVQTKARKYLGIRIFCSFVNVGLQIAAFSQLRWRVLKMRIF